MDDDLRVKGSIAAAGISGLVAGIAVLVGHLEIVVAGAALGIPVGAVLGFRNAPTVARQTAGQAFGSTLVIAGKAVVAGDLAVTIGWVLFAVAAAFGGSDSNMDPLAVVAAVLALPIIGLVFLGLPAFALAFAVTWPWTFVIRRLGRRITTPANPAADGLVAERLG
jgi:hypothetical protein